MTKPTGSATLGRWRITEIEGWEADYVDMLGPGHIQFDRDGGSIKFGAVQIGLDCWYSATGAHFDFHGSDEGTEVFGDGDADLESDGRASAAGATLSLVWPWLPAIAAPAAIDYEKIQRNLVSRTYLTHLMHGMAGIRWRMYTPFTPGSENPPVR